VHACFMHRSSPRPQRQTSGHDRGTFGKRRSGRAVLLVEDPRWAESEEPCRHGMLRWMSQKVAKERSFSWILEKVHIHGISLTAPDAHSGPGTLFRGLAVDCKICDDGRELQSIRNPVRYIEWLIQRYYRFGSYSRRWLDDLDPGKGLWVG
jgi:hypothetical protein